MQVPCIWIYVDIQVNKWLYEVLRDSLPPLPIEEVLFLNINKINVNNMLLIQPILYTYLCKNFSIGSR